MTNQNWHFDPSDEQNSGNNAGQQQNSGTSANDSSSPSPINAPANINLASPPQSNPFGDIGGHTPPPAGMNPSSPFPPSPPSPPADSAPKSNYIFGDIHKNFLTNVKIPPHSLKFDEKQFLKLLAGSISLTKDEKKKIIQSIPKLSQFQIDELIKILEEEKNKFIELSSKHFEQLQKLERKHHEEWKSLEDETVAEEKSKEDTKKAEEIRKKLGLA